MGLGAEDTKYVLLIDRKHIVPYPTKPATGVSILRTDVGAYLQEILEYISRDSQRGGGGFLYKYLISFNTENIHATWWREAYPTSSATFVSTLRTDVDSFPQGITYSKFSDGAWLVLCICLILCILLVYMPHGGGVCVVT